MKNKGWKAKQKIYTQKYIEKKKVRITKEKKVPHAKVNW